MKSVIFSVLCLHTRVNLGLDIAILDIVFLERNFKSHFCPSTRTRTLGSLKMRNKNTVSFDYILQIKSVVDNPPFEHRKSDQIDLMLHAK